MSESCVDNVCFWHSVKQLARTDRRIPSTLTDLALVSCGIEFAEVADGIWRKRQRLQDTRRSVFCMNQPMGTWLVEIFQMGHLSPAPRSIEEATDLLKARDAIPNGILQRGLTAKQKVVVGQGHPAVRVFRRK
jgi:hypothetical protein